MHVVRIPYHVTYDVLILILALVLALLLVLALILALVLALVLGLCMLGQSIETIILTRITHEEEWLDDSCCL